MISSAEGGGRARPGYDRESISKRNIDSMLPGTRKDDKVKRAYQLNENEGSKKALPGSQVGEPVKEKYIAEPSATEFDEFVLYRK